MTLCDYRLCEVIAHLPTAQVQVVAIPKDIGTMKYGFPQ